MPFRSEGEQIREQIRRLEQEQTLLEERAELTRQLESRPVGRKPYRRFMWMGAVLLLSAPIGYVMGNVSAAAKADALRMQRMVATQQNAQMAADELSTCMKRQQKIEADRASCSLELEQRKAAEEIRRMTP